MCEKVTRPRIKAVSRSFAIALVEMAKLVSNLITLILSLAFFGGVNAGGGDKDQKNESDKKTEVDKFGSLVRVAEILLVLSLAANTFYR